MRGIKGLIYETSLLDPEEVQTNPSYYFIDYRRESGLEAILFPNVE